MGHWEGRRQAARSAWSPAWKPAPSRGVRAGERARRHRCGARPRQGLGPLSRLPGRLVRGRDRRRLARCRQGRQAARYRPEPAHPDIGPRACKVKLGRAAGQDDADVFAPGLEPARTDRLLPPGRKARGPRPAFTTGAVPLLATPLRREAASSMQPSPPPAPPCGRRAHAPAGHGHDKKAPGSEDPGARLATRRERYSAARIAGLGSAARVMTGGGTSAGVGRRTPRSSGATALPRWAVAKGLRV